MDSCFVSLHTQCDLCPRPVRDDKSHAPLSFSDLNFLHKRTSYSRINHCFTDS